MEQSMRYKGLALTPDEAAAENGTLALSANCELHDGALRPSTIEGTELEYKLVYVSNNGITTESVVCKLLYIHKTPSYTHLVAIRPRMSQETNKHLVWFHQDGSFGGAMGGYYGDYDEAEQELEQGDFDKYDVVQIESVGNTLVVLQGNGIHYFLWAVESGVGGYKYLGRKPPFVKLAFSLGYKRETSSSGGFGNGNSGTGTSRPDAWELSDMTNWRKTGIVLDHYVDIHSSSDTVNHVYTFKEEYQSLVTEEVWAEVNSKNHELTKTGYFHTNFLVRYCYRMYDGTMIMHSAPIFMPVSMPEHIVVQGAVVADDNDKECLMLRYYPAASKLMYRCEDNDILTSLRNDWSDIITSIDVFISLPIYKSSDGDKIKTERFLAASEYVANIGIQTIYPSAVSSNARYNTLLGRTYPSKLNEDWDEVPRRDSIYLIDVPGKNDSEYARTIHDCANFYKVKSFPINDDFYGETVADPSSSASTSTPIYEVLDIDGDILLTLAQQELMTDDYRTHNYLYPVEDEAGDVASRLYNYNKRIDVSAVLEHMYRGFDVAQMMPYGSGIRMDSYDQDGEYVEGTYGAGDFTIDGIYVEIQTGNGLRVVGRELETPVTYHQWMITHSLYFYPDSRAVATIINYTRSSQQYYLRLKMEACLSLNGAMVMPTEIWGKDTITATGTGHYSPVLDNEDLRPNVIYASDANNPFVFPPSSIYTVGTGLILGMAANTRAISQGQFGQYPLMAMATDGVYALNVSASGTFSSVQPISREVCSNPSSICQLDQQVVMATTRGMSVVTEQNVTPISGMLEGIYKDINTMAPGLTDYFNSLTGAAGLRRLLSFSTPPIDYFQEARVVYDFACNRLLVFREPTSAEKSAGSQPIYVFSIKDGTWSTMASSPIMSAVNGYPHPYLQTTDGMVTVLDKTYPFGDTTLVPTLIVTRALTYGDAMYTIGNIAHVTMETHNPVLFLYGSNDLVTWHYIGRTNQRHVYYLPSRAWRYFRMAIYNELKPGEQYMSTQYDVVPKFGKL